MIIGKVRLIMRIAVLMGGKSKEREVSLRSGDAVANALEKKGHQVERIDAADSLAAQLERFNPDVAFIALHGKFGEDGTVQGLLELMNIPYTGSGVASSAICMNKVLTKRILTSEGIPTAPYLVLNRLLESSSPSEFSSRIIKELGLPVVIKAATQGSTIGTSIVKHETALEEAITESLVYDHEVLAEKFIAGIEVTASVLGNRNPRLLPLIEIVSSSGVYDYESKYTPGGSSHIIPARLSNNVTDIVKAIAIKTFAALGCKGLGRVDIIITDQNQPHVLEMNTIPGMTDLSLFPDAARHAGISFEDLVEEVARLALEETP
ncbi:MAG: D-alanine--D-alanine ligase [Chitinophagales bacterium]